MSLVAGATNETVLSSQPNQRISGVACRCRLSGGCARTTGTSTSGFSGAAAAACSRFSSAAAE